MAQPHALSVVTLVRNRSRHLTNQLRALRRCCPLPDELVVVDMGSAVPAERDLAAVLDDAVPWRVVALPAQPPGLPLAAARNLGAQAVTGDALVFLDVDCIPAPDLFAAYRVADPAALACGPVRYLHEGWEGTAEEPSLDVCDLEACSAPHPARPTPLRDCVDDRHELFWSLSFVVRRTVWARIGGFDPAFVGYGGEDTDFAFTARACGVPVQWLASGTAFHQWHRRTVPPAEHLCDIVANARRFHAKWGVWPMAGWLRAFAAAGLVRWDAATSVLELLDAA